MTDEQKPEELDVVFVGTRKKDKKIRQLAYAVEGTVFFVDVDTKSFLAGERIVRASEKAVEMHKLAKKQGLIEV